MKIVRSSRATLKYATQEKIDSLRSILQEYGKICNVFIDYFWENGVISKLGLLKPIVDIPETWLSARLRKACAREAIGMINSVSKVFDWNRKQLELNIKDVESTILKTDSDTKKNRRKINNLYAKRKKLQNKLSMLSMTKPIHRGNRMCISSTIAELQQSKNSFDSWLHLQSIGSRIIIDLPIKHHKHFIELNKVGKRLNSYIITDNYVQFSFEIETGPKKKIEKVIGVDTGINALASTSDGKQFGVDIKDCIEKVKRCKKGSKGQQRSIRALKQRIDEVAKEVIKNTDLVVVEKLKGLSSNTKLKGRLSKNIRSSIGSWNYSYWMMRLESQCERNRVSFRRVPSYFTSVKCPVCGLTDSKNRVGEMFICLRCGHSDNADINAAINIQKRFLTGKYGSCCKSNNHRDICL